MDKLNLQISTSDTNNIKRHYSWYDLDIASPNRAILIIALSLFVFELIIMFSLHFVPITSEFIIPFIDAGMLLILVLTLYRLFYRPIWNKQRQYASEVSHLSRKLMIQVEEERKRISSDLHDHFGQALSILQLKLERLRKQLPEDDITKSKLAGSIIKDVSQLSDDLRNIIYELRPVMLEDCGLTPSIENLIEEFSRAHPDIRVVRSLHISEEVQINKHESIAISIFRITQELLNNISKHANAQNVSVTLQQFNDRIVLQVEDDGAGFVVRRIHGGKRKGHLGIGLLGINERMRELKGLFTLQTEPGKGTLATIEIPVIYCGGEHG